MLTRPQKTSRSLLLGAIAYQSVAFATKGRVPFLSWVIRELPRPARFAVSLAVAAAIHDHFDTQRFF